MTADPSDGNDALRVEIARLEARLASEAAAAQAERERLTYELGHRVKNTLSVVQALAGQTLRGTAPDDAVAAFGERILALARANDAILKESWTTATIESIARSVLFEHGRTPGPLGIEGPLVRVRASAALSFAMALHELATNAKRFGAWSVPTGRVDIAWSTAGSLDAVFELTWTESSGPPSIAPDKRGFGLRLVDQSLRSAFGRDVDIAFSPGGLMVRVRAPLSTVTP